MNAKIRESLLEYRMYWQTVESPIALEQIDTVESPIALEQIDTIDRLLAGEFPLNDAELVTWLEELQGPSGCDFKEDADGQVTWTCPGGTDKSQSEAILARFGLGSDEIALAHAYADVFGGHCSCEIVFNAAERMLPDD